MSVAKRVLWLTVATLMLTPGKAKAKGRVLAAIVPGDPPQKQNRRRADRGSGALQALAPVRSPCGRHVLEVTRGAVMLNGRRVHPQSGSVYVMSPPTWRRDGRAVAWLERAQGETRLVVVAGVESTPEPLPWSLPGVDTADQIFWAGPTRVVVGPTLLAPRAVASWSEGPER